MIYTETVFLSDTYKNAVCRSFIEAWNMTKAGDTIHKALISFSLTDAEEKERAQSIRVCNYFYTFLPRVLAGEFQHKYTYMPKKQWVKTSKKALTYGNNSAAYNAVYA